MLRIGKPLKTRFLFGVNKFRILKVDGHWCACFTLMLQYRLWGKRPGCFLPVESDFLERKTQILSDLYSIAPWIAVTLWGLFSVNETKLYQSNLWLVWEKTYSEPSSHNGCIASFGHLKLLITFSIKSIRLIFNLNFGKIPETITVCQAYDS